MKPKIIAMYLPQYHQIPENDEFWGEGFTDWVTVKNAKPLFEGHQQPRIPLNNNYYDLSKEEHVKWQAKLARDYGIYGFGVYHYWFNNEKNLLTRPAEILRDMNPDEAVKYFFIWDNCNWTRSWSNIKGNDWAPLADDKIKKQTGPKILIPYVLGREKDWENHYNYLKQHFHSKNYELNNNKPLFGIIWPSKEIYEMASYMNKLAKADGWDGIEFIYLNVTYKNIPKNALRYNYQPHHTAWYNNSIWEKILAKLLNLCHINLEKNLTTYEYDKVWCKLLQYAKQHPEPQLIHGAFVGYDDSPRRGAIKSKIVIGQNAQSFKKYLKELIEICVAQNKQYLFLTAWNEWGEGAYLEPDIDSKFRYLESIKNAINSI